VSTQYAEGDVVEVRRGSKWIRAKVLPHGPFVGSLSALPLRREDTGRRIYANVRDMRHTRAASSFNVPAQDARHARGLAVLDAMDRADAKIAAGFLSLAAEGGQVPPLRAVPKPRKAKRSRSYADFVRAHACQNCGAPPPSEHAHLGPRGMSQKADDRCANALCASNPATGYVGCHAFWHQHGTLPVRGAAGYPLVGYDPTEAKANLYRWQRDLLIAFLDRSEECDDAR